VLLIILKEKRPRRTRAFQKNLLQTQKNCASSRLGPGFPKNSSLVQHDRWLIAAYFIFKKNDPGFPKNFSSKQKKMPGFPKKSSTNKIKIVHRSSFPKKKFPKKNTHPPQQRVPLVNCCIF